LNRRVIGLLLAIVLAGIATFFLVQYVTSADERAREEEALAEVFVAQADIPAGTTAEAASTQGLIGRDQIAARTVPDGAIGDLDDLTGLVATGPIFPGEIIVAQRFGTTVAQVAGLLEIPEGLQAVTVEAGVSPGLAGFVQPDDLVSVLASVDLPVDVPPVQEEGEDAAPPETTASGGFTTQYIVQNVSVLAVGQRVVVPEAEGEQTTGIEQSNERYLFTLAMTPDDIEKVVFSTQQGALWFTLVPQPEDEEEEPEVFVTPGRTLENVFE
jgi:pilus assembly protein CpaB